MHFLHGKEMYANVNHHTANNDTGCVATRAVHIDDTTQVHVRHQYPRVANRNADGRVHDDIDGVQMYDAQQCLHLSQLRSDLLAVMDDNAKRSTREN
jgi:hypothetical protein